MRVEINRQRDLHTIFDDTDVRPARACLSCSGGHIRKPFDETGGDGLRGVRSGTRLDGFQHLRCRYCERFMSIEDS